MNSKQSIERRKQRLAKLAQPKRVKKKCGVHSTTTDDFALSDVPSHGVHTTETPSGIPDKFPDPWLIDSEFLLTELARLRDLILRVPIHNNTVLPIQTAVDSIWRLEYQLRYLLGLHKEGQRSFAQKTAPTETGEIPACIVHHTNQKVAGIKA